MGFLNYDDLIKGGKIFNRWEQAVKDAINGNAGDIVIINDNLTKVEPSIASLSQLSTDVILGQNVKVTGYYDGTALGGGDFEAIDITKREKLTFVPASSQGISGGAMPTPISGDTFTIRIKVNSLPSSGYVMTLGGGAGRLNLSTSVANFSSDFKFTTIGYGTVFSITHPYKSEELDIVKFGVWYDVAITLDLNVITSFDIANPFGTHLDVEVSQFSLVGENFLINSNTSIVGDNGTVATVINSPVLGDLDIDNGFDLIQAENVTYKKHIVNNRATVYDFGAHDSDSLEDYTQDSTSAIQAAMDSEYQIEIPPGFFYISSAITISRPKILYMSSAAGVKSIFNSPFNDPNSLRETSTIFSDQNIDYIVIKSGDVHIHNGCIYTANSSNHTKSAYRYDLGAQMWNGSLNNIYVEGNESELLTTGIGTIGVMIDQVNATSTGFATSMEFSGQVKYCAKGVYITGSGASNTFQNSFWFKIHTAACKQCYNIESSSLVTIDSISQDGPVLNLAESTLYAFDINASISEVNLFVYDTERQVGDDPAEYRHENYKYRLQGTAVSLGHRSAYYYNRDQVDMYGIAPNKHATIVQDPKTFFISDYKGVISKLDNAIRFAQEYGAVSYLGYEMPNDAWRDLNLYPSDDILNPTPLSVSGNVTIQNPTFLLSTNPNRTVTVTHTIADVPTLDLHFAEIVVSDIPNIGNIGLTQKVSELLLSLGTGKPLKIQTIIRYASGAVYNSTNELPSGSYYEDDNLYKLLDKGRSAYTNEYIESLIIRIIGQDKTNVAISVRDIVLKTQYPVNKTMVETHGDQKIVGNLEAASFSVTGVGIAMTAGTSTQRWIGSTLIIYLTSTGAHTIAAISTVVNEDFFIKFENISGGDATVSATGGDTIDGAASQLLLDTETIELHIKGTNFTF